MNAASYYETEGGATRTALGAYLKPQKGSKDFSSKATAEEVSAAWDGRGKVAIITGANTGLGREAARVLAARGAEVIMAVRDVARGQEAAATILAQHPSAKLSVMSCDLASLASVRHFADSFLQLNKPCHIVLANAGVMACPFGRTTDGHETQFGTNHLGHFALVQQLMPVLEDSGKAAAEPARVVVLSSAAHFSPYAKKKGGPILLDSMDSELCYHPFFAYGQSKLCNLLFARELHRRLTAEGAPVTVAACHPGLIATELGRHINKSVAPLLQRMFKASLAWAFKSVEQGAATPVYLCTSPHIKGGEYYADCRVAAASAASHDAGLAARLWALSEAMVWAVPLVVPPGPLQAYSQQQKPVSRAKAEADPEREYPELFL